MVLFQKKAEPQVGPSVLTLPLSAISPNPNQPRRVFAPAELEELAASIRELGVLQPLTVRDTPSGWELVAGERRLRAAALAGLDAVPCLAVEADDRRSSLMALVENVQRQDLDFWEEALALDRLIDTCGLSQGEAAQKIGKSQSAVANKLRLLKLPADVLMGLRDGGCTERHARALLRLPDAAAQRRAAEYILDKRLNVAQTEGYVDSLLSPAARPRRCKPVYRIRDVRLFLNTITRGLSMMNAAGVRARCGREETDSEILLTIRIPKTADHTATAG